MPHFCWNLLNDFSVISIEKWKSLQWPPMSCVVCTLSIPVSSHVHPYSFPSSPIGLFDVLPTLDLSIGCSLCLECPPPRYGHDFLHVSYVTREAFPGHSIKKYKIIVSLSPGHPICLCPILFSTLINTWNVKYYWFVWLAPPLTWLEYKHHECVVFLFSSLLTSPVPTAEQRS